MTAARNFIASVMMIVCVISCLAENSTKPSFSLSIRALHAVYKPGELILIIVTTTNVSDHIIDFGRSSNPASVYKISVTDGDGKPAQETELTKKVILAMNGNNRRHGSLSVEPVAPGKTSDDPVSVNLLYDMSRPGQYTIQLRQHDPDSNSVVISNAITVTVNE